MGDSKKGDWKKLLDASEATVIDPLPGKFGRGAPELHEAEPTPSEAEDASEPELRTQQDLAALIGLPPEPRRPVVVQPPPPAIVPLPIAPRLFLDTETPPAQAKRPPREGIDVRRIETTRDATSAFSKLVPTILMLLLLVMAGAVAYRWLRPDGGGQHHVELKLLAPSGASSPSDEEGSTMLDFDTEPSGVAVLYAGSIIGRTPFRSRLPIAIVEGTGVELTSPFFQPWIQPAEITADGELRIRARLSELR